MRHRSITNVVATLAIVALAAGCGASGADDSGASGKTDDVAAPTATESTATESTATESTTDEPAAQTERSTDGDSNALDETVDTDAVDEPVEAPSDDPSATNDASTDAAPGVIAVSLTSAEETAADDPVAQAIVAAFPPGFSPPTDEQARCIGGKIVNELGTDRLAELGVTADTIDVFGATDFEPDEVDAMVDILFECVDVEIMVASMFAPSAGPETAECFADFVDESLIRELAAPFLGGGAMDTEGFLEQVQAANAACLSADS